MAGDADDDLPLALAASSFADGTRVAGTRPELVLAMCEGNRDALLAAVDDALGRPGRHARGAGVDRRPGRDGEGRVRGPDALVGDARAAGAPGVADGAPVLAELREIGRRGEVVTGWA